jgi:hypothetical protein
MREYTAGIAGVHTYGRGEGTRSRAASSGNRKAGLADPFFFFALRVSERQKSRSDTCTNFFAIWPFSSFFPTFMPLTVSFQKMDP